MGYRGNGSLRISKEVRVREQITASLFFCNRQHPKNSRIGKILDGLANDHSAPRAVLGRIGIILDELAARYFFRSLLVEPGKRRLPK